MQESINGFIKHTIVNLQGALDKDDNKLTLAVLINLADVIESYVEAMQDELELV
jgi:hypothetical protein